MKLQFITHQTNRYSYEESALLALKGGCRWIQLRIKNASDEDVRPIALRVQALCKDYNAVFLLDDRVELARSIKADGVHLGKNDMPITEARQLLGNNFILGGTANTFEDVKRHYDAGANYIGCGPFRYTTTKKKLSPILGLEGYRSIVKQMEENNIHLPIVGIGGITYSDIEDVIHAGLDGVALSGTILQAPNPIEETQRIVTLVNSLTE